MAMGHPGVRVVSDPMRHMPRRALLSVSDKAGIVAFARALVELGVALLSTGGTRQALGEAGIDSVELSDHMGFPEIMDGRVKTLHPKVHGGILARDEEDAGALREHGIDPIDLVVVNLYPFAEAAAANAGREAAIAQIDIGGPTLLRGAAKNHARVAAVADPADYDAVIEALRAGGFTAGERFEFAAKAFAHTARYDAAIAAWFAAQSPGAVEEPAFPDTLTLSFAKRDTMRYGENPHQRAAFYMVGEPRSGTVGGLEQLHGKALSYNNVVDVDAALDCVRGFDAPACAIIKHASPCGVAVAATAREAYAKAFAADRTSAFGGVIAFNRALGTDTLQAVLDAQFVEAVVAPEVDAQAVARAKPSVRLLRVGPLDAQPGPLAHRQVSGGLLAQEADTLPAERTALTTVTARPPSQSELDDLWFAWRVAAFVKSNAIVIARGGATLGIGGGQTSRVGSVGVATARAVEEGHALAGAALASDAFFPFRDGLDLAAKAGVTAVIQPGGSKRDAECIAAANEHGMAMVFTGERHFRH